MARNLQEVSARGAVLVHASLELLEREEAAVSVCVYRGAAATTGSAWCSCAGPTPTHMRMVVGWRRIQEGTQPLSMNKGPSFLRDSRITPIVPRFPFAFMTRDLMTSAGEQTVVATVP